jgi:predicted lipoprotein
MSDVSILAMQISRKRVRRYAVIGVVVVAVIAAMALDTKVVKIGSADDAQEQGFSPDSYGQKTFPTIQQDVLSRAVEAKTLAEALQANQAEAVKKYGVGTPLPVFAVKLEGVVQAGQMGIFPLKVEGMPEGTQVRLQTGPAITGTDLRDASGKIQFGDFTNQIEYQNAGSAINRAMKTAVLDKLDREALPGKTVQVVGVFRLLNAKNWMVTPVSMEVK